MFSTCLSFFRESIHYIGVNKLVNLELRLRVNRCDGPHEYVAPQKVAKCAFHQPGGENGATPGSACFSGHRFVLVSTDLVAP